MSRSSCKSRERVAWVTRSFCAASPRRNSSWLAIRRSETNRRIWPWRNVLCVFMVQRKLPTVFLYSPLHSPVNSIPEILTRRSLAKAQEASHVRFATLARSIVDFSRGRCNLAFSAIRLMGTACQISGCKNEAPPALTEQRLCVLHFTLALETSCSEMRRETALGNAPHERQREIMKFITEHGEVLARVATIGLHLPDDLRRRTWSTFLTLCIRR